MGQYLPRGYYETTKQAAMTVIVGSTTGYTAVQINDTVVNPIFAHVHVRGADVRMIAGTSTAYAGSTAGEYGDGDVPYDLPLKDQKYIYVAAQTSGSTHWVTGNIHGV